MNGLRSAVAVVSSGGVPCWVSQVLTRGGAVNRSVERGLDVTDVYYRVSCQ